MNNPQAVTLEDEEEGQIEIVEDLIDKAKVLILDKVDKLDPWEMQELVGGLLVAMGYNVQVSPKGPDGGVDILAYKDAFGFEKPIIKVQVKHRKSSASAPEVQQLLGANPIDANALFVSTGGYTSHAEVVAKQFAQSRRHDELLKYFLPRGYDEFGIFLMTMVLLGGGQKIRMYWNFVVVSSNS